MQTKNLRAKDNTSPAMEKKKIVAIGEMLWDMMPLGKALGGAPLNFAYWAARRGCEAAAISAIGRDSLGEEILKVTQGIGVTLSAMQVNDFPTGTVGVSLSEDGVPEYTIHENVAWDNIEDSTKAYALVREADAICWGSLAQRSAKCRDAILRLIDAAPDKCLKVFDINLRQNFYSRETIEASLRRADILKLNEDELPIVERMLGLSGPIAIMETYQLLYLVYTCGAEKSEIFGRIEGEGRQGEGSVNEGTGVPNGNHPYALLSSIATPIVKVVNTVGAGDSFTAAFVAGILSGLSPAAAHADAVALSAHVCTLPGGIG